MTGVLKPDILRLNNLFMWFRISGTLDCKRSMRPLKRAIEDYPAASCGQCARYCGPNQMIIDGIKEQKKHASKN